MDKGGSMIMGIGYFTQEEYDEGLRDAGLTAAIHHPIGPGTPKFPEHDYSGLSKLIEEAKDKKPLDIQVGGSHYKTWAIQPIEFLQANKVPPCEANIIKYTCRHREKNGVEDLRKAMHYLQILMEMEYGVTE